MSPTALPVTTAPPVTPETVLEVHAAAYAVAKAGWKVHLITGHAPTLRVQRAVARMTVQDGVVSDQIDVEYNGADLKILSRGKGREYFSTLLEGAIHPGPNQGAGTGRLLARLLYERQQREHRERIFAGLNETVEAHGLMVFRHASEYGEYQCYLLHPDLAACQSHLRNVGVPVKVAKNGDIFGQVAGVVIEGVENILGAAAAYFAAILPLHQRFAPWSAADRAAAANQ